MILDKFTIATTHTEAMVAFYNAVFHAGLTPIAGTPFYAGSLAGFALMFCPNDIVQIKAEKNRIQMRFTVDDLAAVMAKASAHGGGPYGERYEDDSTIGWGIHDPDGNSIELRQVKEGTS